MVDLPIAQMPLPVAPAYQPMPLPAAVAPGPTAATDIGLLLDQGASNSSSIADEWMTLLSDKRSVGAVADALRAGDLKGTDKTYLTNKISQVMNQTNGNAAQAAAIITASLRGAEQGLIKGKLSRWIDGTPRLAGGVQIDNDVLKQFVREAKVDPKTGASPLETVAVAQAGRERSRGEIMAAQASVDQAKRVYSTALSELQKGDIRMNAVLPQLEEAVRIAEQNYQGIQTSINPPPPERAKPKVQAHPVPKASDAGWVNPMDIFANTH